MVVFVAHVADVHDEPWRQLTLNRHMPALDVPGSEVLRNVVDAAVEGIEVPRHVEPFRVPHLRRPKTGGGCLARRAQALRRRCVIVIGTTCGPLNERRFSPPNRLK